MRRAIALSAVWVLATLAGCGRDEPGGDTITVFAAASLTQSFSTLGEQFEHDHPGTKITFSFAASSALASQIMDGAPADVFASASESTMDQLVQAGMAGEPTIFATNSMRIAVPPANPGGVASLSDLANPDVKTALCQPQVPCGATAMKVFANEGIAVTPVTLEPDVKAVLGKVTLGEVDAGMVYVTDVLAAGSDVVGIVIPAAANSSTSYPIATLSASSNPATAAAFVEFIHSPEGDAVLSATGFAQP